jgi:hypothetical protein
MKKHVEKTTKNLVSNFVLAKAFFLFCFVAYSLIGLAHVHPNKSSKEQRKEELITELSEKLTSFLSTIKAKQELVMSQKNELQAELEKYENKKKTKKTQEADEQMKKLLQDKIASLENKQKEYQKMESEAIALQTTLESQIITTETEENPDAKTNSSEQ